MTSPPSSTTAPSLGPPLERGPQLCEEGAKQWGLPPPPPPSLLCLLSPKGSREGRPGAHHFFFFDNLFRNLLNIVILFAFAVPDADYSAAQGHDDNADDCPERAATAYSNTSAADNSSTVAPSNYCHSGNVVLIVAISPSVEVVSIPIIVGQHVIVRVVPQSVVVVGRQVVDVQPCIGSAASEIGIVRSSSGGEPSGPGDLSRSSSG